MKLPDLNTIALPDLTGPQYPAVAWESLCTVAAVPPKPCWPQGLYAVGIPVVNPYAYPTVPLGRIKTPWMRIRTLFPIPPSIGVHCGNLIDNGATVNVVPGGASSATWNREITQKPDDSCPIYIQDVLTIPCIFPTFVPGVVNMTGSGTIGSTSATITGSGCNLHVGINVQLPDLGGGTITAAAPTGWLTVGDATDNKPKWGWETSGACVTDDDTTGCIYNNTNAIPVMTDTNGFFGGPGLVIDTTSTLGAIYRFQSIDSNPIFCGDRVLVQATVPPAGSITYTLYKVALK